MESCLQSKFVSRSRFSSNFKLSTSSLLLELERNEIDKNHKPYLPGTQACPASLMPKEATALQSREAWALPAPGPGMGSTRAIKGGLQQPQAFFRPSLDQGNLGICQSPHCKWRALNSQEASSLLALLRFWGPKSKKINRLLKSGICLQRHLKIQNKRHTPWNH